MQALSAEGVRLFRNAVCPRTHPLLSSDLVKLLLEVASTLPSGSEKAVRLIEDADLDGSGSNDDTRNRLLVWRIEQLVTHFQASSAIHTLLRAQAVKLDPDFDVVAGLPASIRMAMRNVGELTRAQSYSRGWMRRLGLMTRAEQRALRPELESRSKIERAIDEVVAAATPAEALDRYSRMVSVYVDAPLTDIRSEMSKFSDRLPFRVATISEPFNRMGDSKSSLRGYAALELPLPTPAPARSALEITAILRTEFPWLPLAIDSIELDLMLSLQFNLGCVLAPKMLFGEPGCGKTSFCIRVGELLEQPHQVVNAAGASSPRLLIGSARGWGTARPALPAEVMAQAGRAQCLLVMDELDKESSGDYSGRLSDALLNFLEPSTASRYYDECLLSRCDFSKVNWLCTSNDLRRVSPPLLSRLQLIECGQPRPEHMMAIAESVVASVRRSYRAAADFELLDSQGRFELETLAPSAGTARACARLARAKVGESLRRKVRSAGSSEPAVSAALLH